MPSAADARFLFARVVGLFRRGWASVHTRGWRASWERARLQLQPRRALATTALYAPADIAFAPFAVPHASADEIPRASVVIPVYNHFPHTLACLRALAAPAAGQLRGDRRRRRLRR